MGSVIKHVVIVGGGSAGWLTAGVIAAEHRPNSATGFRVTLIESPDVKTIGVGEGTWPTMRDTLRNMGASETRFLRECDASFKQGSKFVKWVNGDDGDYYYHPFVLPSGYNETNLVAEWQRRHAGVPFADLVSFQPHLCEQGKAPKQKTTPEFAAVANYAYHLDAGKFGQFLQKHCIENLGVTHVLDHVRGISSAQNGDIESLQTDKHGELEGDLFIDCTGFAAVLIGQHYDVPFISRKNVLFNDTALAVQVPYPDDNSPIASHTISTAQAAGWVWDIGLPTRRGIGHVYSSSHTSDAEAESALRTYIEQTTRDMRGVLQPSNAQSQVDSLLDQVDAPVVEIEIELHPGMQLAESGDRFAHVAHTERHGQCDAQFAPQFRVFLLDSGLRLVQVRQYPRAVFVEARAGLGQVQYTRRATQQLHAEALLQRRYAPTHCRLRRIQTIRRCREAASLNNCHKCL